MAKRTYQVKGTKDFLVLALIFFFLGLWAVKDGWYPSPKVLKKHPLEMAVSFEIPGTIARLHVQEGDMVGEGQVLAELHRVKLESEFAEAKKTYTATKKQFQLMDAALKNAAKNGSTIDGFKDRQQRWDEAKAEMDQAVARANEIRSQLDATELLAPDKGEVKQVLAFVHNQVEAGQTVMVLDPNDHFYTFNKSLAIFSALAFCVFMGLHILAR
jgi:multidrug resistance efflux pump